MSARRDIIHVKSPSVSELIQAIGKVDSPSERKKLLNMLPVGMRVKIYNQMAKENSLKVLDAKLKRVSPKTRASLMKMLPPGTRAKLRWKAPMTKIRALRAFRARRTKPSGKKSIALGPALRRHANNLAAAYKRKHPTPNGLSENAQVNYRAERNIRAWKNALAQINAGSRPNVVPVQRRPTPPKQFSTKYKAQLRSFFNMKVPNVQNHANGMGVSVSRLYEMMHENYQNRSGRVAPTHVKNKRPKVKGGVRALVSGTRRSAKTSAMKAGLK